MLMCTVFLGGSTDDAPVIKDRDNKLVYRSVFMFLPLNRWQRSLLCHESTQRTSKQLGWLYTVSTGCFGGTCRTNKTGHNRSFVKLSQTCEVMQLLGWNHCGLSGPCLEEVSTVTRARAALLLLSCLLMGSFWIFVQQPQNYDLPLVKKKQNNYLACVF